MSSLQKLITLKHQIDQLKDSKLEFKDIYLILQDTLNKLDITNNIVDQFVNYHDALASMTSCLLPFLFVLREWTCERP